MTSYRQSISIVLVSSFCILLTSCGRSPEEPVAFKVEEESAAEAEAKGQAVVKKSAPQGKFKKFRVYTDANSPDNHYAPSGWMGDWGDIKLTTAHFENPHGGSTCMKIQYTAQSTQGANWAGMYWQNPPNNWGSEDGGYDLTGVSKFTFWARGEKGGEKIEEFRVGGIPGEYPDSDIAGIGPILLNKEWTQYEIDLGDKDMSFISGGFMWSANVDGNPEGFVLYLDDMVYE